MQRIKTIHVVGDKVLIRPDEGDNRTAQGLYLPPGVKEKEQVQTGFIVKVGPGYPVVNPRGFDREPWEEQKNPLAFVPLQAEEGDYAMFLRKEAVEIEFEGESMVVVPQSAILILIRNEFRQD